MSAKRDVRTVAKDIGLFFAAPFIALIYLALFPVIGIMVWSNALKAKKSQGR